MLKDFYHQASTATIAVDGLSAPLQQLIASQVQMRKTCVDPQGIR